MGRIKQIWYDCSVINDIEIEEKLQSLQIPFMRISKNNLLVQSELSAHSLYDQLGSVISKKGILIGGFDPNDYWGYMDGGLWTWIKSINAQ